MGHPILSVALCTYNGEKYLREQLGSILAQTRLPDEIIVCDDRSRDDTIHILERFEKRAPFNVKIFRNEKQLGTSKNFEKAIALCEGDIIACCDQDDVWLPLKLEKLLQMLSDHPEASYIFSDALVVDEQLAPLGYSMWESIEFTSRERNFFRRGRQLEVLLKHNVVTGATMAFRSEIKDSVLPIPEEWIHDAWIAFIVGGTEAIGVFIETPLIKYRQHSDQAIGGRKVGFKARLEKAKATKAEAYLEASEKFGAALERLTDLGKTKTYRQKLVCEKIQHLITRNEIMKIPYPARIKLIIGEFFAGRYHKYSLGWRSMAKDLLLSKNNKLNV